MLFKTAKIIDKIAGKKEKCSKLTKQDKCQYVCVSYGPIQCNGWDGKNEHILKNAHRLVPPPQQAIAFMRRGSEVQTPSSPTPPPILPSCSV